MTTVVSIHAARAEYFIPPDVEHPRVSGLIGIDLVRSPSRISPASTGICYVMARWESGDARIANLGVFKERFKLESGEQLGLLESDAIRPRKTMSQWTKLALAWGGALLGAFGVLDSVIARYDGLLASPAISLSVTEDLKKVAPGDDLSIDAEAVNFSLNRGNLCVVRQDRVETDPLLQSHLSSFAFASLAVVSPPLAVGDHHAFHVKGSLADETVPFARAVDRDPLIKQKAQLWFLARSGLLYGERPVSIAQDIEVWPALARGPVSIEPGNAPTRRAFFKFSIWVGSHFPAGFAATATLPKEFSGSQIKFEERVVATRSGGDGRLDLVENSANPSDETLHWTIRPVDKFTEVKLVLVATATPELSSTEWMTLVGQHLEIEVWPKRGE